MRQLFLFLFFAAAIAGLGYAAVTPVSAGAAYAPWATERTGVAARLPAELSEKATAALAENALDWASVAMDGQIAILSGEAPREEERAEAIAALLASVGPGGWVQGGVVAVRDLTTLAPPISPYEWRAVRSGDRVTLAGATPTRASRAELVAYAGELFPGGVADQMIIARGAPDEPAWVGVARAAIAQVAALEDGRATLRDERLTIEGRAPDILTRNRVTDALAYLPSPFLAAARVESPAGPGGEPESAALTAEQIYEPISDIGVCREVFASLMAEGSVDFAANEPAIAKESYPLLDRLAIAAIRCEGMQVTITGGGEAASEGDAYADLGLRRAQAVADYFILKGIAQDRLAAEAREASADAAPAESSIVSFDINP
jgi:outer membrane protein OmpA-like peptidoglycan-associated protein